jgi:iron complex transport system ATP-binding protein
MQDIAYDSPLLSVEHATVVKSGKRVLDDLSLEVRLGRHTAILGPNGSGKSSLIKLLTRQYYPLARQDDQPTVRILGEDRWDVSQLRKKLGIVSADMQKSFSDDGSYSGYEVAVSGFFASVGVPAHLRVTDEMRTTAIDALDAIGARHLADRPFGELSTGESRRVLIARALVSQPLALILDEPTTGLDIGAQQAFLDKVRELAQGGTTIVLVTHHIEEVLPEVEHVILLKDGRVFADGLKAEVLTAANLSAQYGLPIHLHSRGSFFSAHVERHHSH